MTVPDPAERFTDRVKSYARYRPSYPVRVVKTLEEAGVSPARSRVLDLGCGTGISSTLFLREGYSVIGVEPNDEMRTAAEGLRTSFPKFRVEPGRAEEIPLGNSCCDLIVCAQAFHWFERGAARVEMKRVLTTDGLVALLWNHRKTDSSPFLREYEALLLQYGTDYAHVRKRYPDEAAVAAFFGPDGCDRRIFQQQQTLTRQGLRGRAASSSYVPQPGHPYHSAFMSALTRLFDRHAIDGSVEIVYDVMLYYGFLS